MPPRWALGNLMSRFGYTSQVQAESITAKMKEQNIPMDAIIFDLFWFGDSVQNTLGNLAWINKTKWPDPAGMVRSFKQQHINTILITEPFVVTSSLNYTNTKQYQAVDGSDKPFMLTNFYFGKGGLLDIFRKDAQKWFWSKYSEQMKIGVEAWWGDLGEPETHPVEMYHNLKDMGFKRLFKADEVHNIYGHVWTKMLFDQYAKEYPTKRLFSLNRSGFAGTQRYGIFPWSGDVSRSWSGLKAQLPIMLGMSMSGIPYVHADAGGFAGGEGDKELYIRWLQFAAFTPIFRPHGTAMDDSAFPSEPALMEEPYRGYAKKIVKERYALLPYNYTLAYRQTVYGEPLVAPLYYYYPKDTVALNVSDEFMWGQNILVAPVLEKDAKQRNVYLPQGNWYKLNSADKSSIDLTVYKNTIEESLSIENIPVFAKAGSFIPTIIKEDGGSTFDYTTDTLTVHYFSDTKRSDYTMYDDDGSTKQAIVNKAFELINFTAEPLNKNIKFSVTSNGGTYPGKPVKRIIKMIVHGPVTTQKNVYINNSKKKITIPYKGRESGPADLYNFTFEIFRDHLLK